MCRKNWYIYVRLHSAFYVDFLWHTLTFSEIISMILIFKCMATRLDYTTSRTWSKRRQIEWKKIYIEKLMKECTVYTHEASAIPFHLHIDWNMYRFVWRLTLVQLKNIKMWKQRRECEQEKETLQRKSRWDWSEEWRKEWWKYSIIIGLQLN